MIMGAIVNAPQEHYDAIMDALYPRVTYRKADMPQPMPLKNGRLTTRPTPLTAWTWHTC